MSPAPDGAVHSRLSAAVRRHSPMPLHHQIKVAVLEGVEQDESAENAVDAS